MNDHDIGDTGADARFGDVVVPDDQFPATDEQDDQSSEPDEGFAVNRRGAGPSGWQSPEPTGVQAVDDAVVLLTSLDELPTSEHVAHYETVHRHLQDALADLDGA